MKNFVGLEHRSKIGRISSVILSVILLQKIQNLSKKRESKTRYSNARKPWESKKNPAVIETAGFYLLAQKEGFELSEKVSKPVVGVGAFIFYP